MKHTKLYRSVQILLFLFLLFAGLHFAKGFLLPVSFGIFFATLLVPFTEKLERKGVHCALAILICMICLFAVLAGIIMLTGWQLSGLSDEISQAKDKFTEFEVIAKRFIRDTLGISVRDQEKIVEEQATTTGTKPEQLAGKILIGFFGFLGNSILTIVYTFFFIYYRHHLKKFILALVKKDSKSKALRVMEDCQEVGQKYIIGMAKMILWLWILYSIGFSVVGIKHAIMFAVIGGTLEIIPFVGNLIAVILTMIMAMIQGGGPAMYLGVVAVYILVQFIQGYILEPYIVGSEVNLNPLFTIVALVLGQIVWGIPGMVLAIPTLGIAKIICDNIESLKPYGFLLGMETKPKMKRSFIERIRRKRNKN